MNASDLIESYVTEVAGQLPRRQRNDVAFELRALLTEELQARAEAAGRPADAAMATELLRGFGRPAEVAARYRPTLTIIDPADGHEFLRVAVVGLVIIWCAGLWVHLRQPLSTGDDLIRALVQWWGKVVIPSLWWPGVLVVSYGGASWARRRRPRSSEWKPRAGDRVRAGRAGLVMAIIGASCGLFLIMDPHWLLDVLFGGRAAPAAYEALTYTDAFRRHQAPWLFGLVMLNIPLWITVVVMGRWSAVMRRLETGLALATCAVMAWVALDGPVLMAPDSDRLFKSILVLLVVFTLICIGIKMYRSVKPTPNGQVHAQR